MLEIVQLANCESGNEARAMAFQKHATNYSSFSHEWFNRAFAFHFSPNKASKKTMKSLLGCNSEYNLKIKKQRATVLHKQMPRWSHSLEGFCIVF